MIVDGGDSVLLEGVQRECIGGLGLMSARGRNVHDTKVFRCHCIVDICLCVGSHLVSNLLATAGPVTHVLILTTMCAAPTPFYRA